MEEKRREKNFSILKHFVQKNPITKQFKLNKQKKVKRLTKKKRDIIKYH